MNASLHRRIVAEATGTAMLLAAVVGSGIMAEQLSSGNQAIALLANTIATGAALVALILTFGPTSGAHFNPAVTVADASQGGLAWHDVPGYVIRAMQRRRARRLGGARHVRATAVHAVFARAKRASADVQ
jgi:glycerol uptake facilitator-like aquaporin